MDSPYGCTIKSRMTTVPSFKCTSASYSPTSSLTVSDSTSRMLLLSNVRREKSIEVDPFMSHVMYL